MLSVEFALAHAAARDALLERIVAALRADERFVAAWLRGSFGRGDDDALSDLDLDVVLRDTDASVVCARPWQTGGQTTPERQELFSRFGTPTILIDMHPNAPEGGSFTTVVYESALHTDWTLIPQASARRPRQSRLLFDKAAIPVEAARPPETREQRRDAATQDTASFWMAAGVAAKYRLRGWHWDFHMMLNSLHSLLGLVRQRVEGADERWRRYSPVEIAATPEAQAATLRALCDEMEALMPEVVRLGGQVPDAPRAIVEKWLLS